MSTKKEIAKFAAGAAAWEAIGHLFLAFTGLLPLTVWGITLTQTFNGVWIVIVASVSVLLAWYAWGSVPRREVSSVGPRVHRSGA